MFPCFLKNSSVIYCLAVFLLLDVFNILTMDRCIIEPEDIQRWTHESRPIIIVRPQD